MTTFATPEIVHSDLACGIQCAVLPLPHRHVVTFQMRVLAGACSDPSDKVGLAQIVEDTLDKGTHEHTGRELSDAFDEIGAARRSATGRETTTFTCTVLPEHFERAVALHAEMLKAPTFPEDAFRVAVDLSKQELTALDDDAHRLADKLLCQRVFGTPLGRHPLGEKDTLDAIDRAGGEAHWRRYYHAGRMIVAVAGAVEPDRATDVFETQFAGFGDASHAGRSAFPVAFADGVWHHDKPLEQEQIGLAWPGVAVTHDDYPVQQVVLGVLSGGMSGRLFTEVREKKGLVYWVSAWQEAPRGAGMLFMGASTKPERCDETYTTLLSEVDRLAGDIHREELDRAITGIVAGDETRGDATSARCAELVGDMFHFGRPIPTEEKIRKIEAVTVDDVKRYLETYPRDRRCVVTLGPKPLAAGA